MSDRGPAIAALRQTASALFAEALRAADPRAAVAVALGSRTRAFEAGRWSLIAAGKAARAMVTGAADVLDCSPVAGVVVEPAQQAPSAAGLPRWPLEWRRARHPLPDRGGLLAARAVERCVAAPRGRRGAETFLVLLSGGASALLPAPPPQVSLADKVQITALLLAAGAPIEELNAVRKHLSRLKGGGLARLVAPRETVVLVLSDVVTDDLSVIASGPLAPDPTTFADAAAVLERRGVQEGVPASVRRRLERGARGDLPETAKPGDPAFSSIAHLVVASNRSSLDAAAGAAASSGFAVERGAAPLVGEARDAAESVMAAARGIGAGRAAYLRGGETTVTVRGRGRGGRNQELALAFALVAERERALAGRAWCLLSAATDGVDGPTDAAGAVVDAGTLARCRAAGVDPVAALASNDSHRALEASGDLLRTGPTGTNVCDLQALLVERG